MRTTQTELVLPRLHPAQRGIKRDARRFNVLACGRRFGKTMLGHDLAIHPLLKGQPVGWFAPTYKVLIEAWQEIERLLHPITRRVSERDKRIETWTGAAFEAWTLEDPNAGRSRKYGRVLVDEAAMAHNLGAAWQEAIRPSLSDYAGDAAFFSTPKGRNYFWQLWQRGQDDAKGEWASWQLPTSANPYIQASEIEAARQELPERIFRQEYLAEFLEDAGGVFRGVRDVCTAGRVAPYAGTFRMGVDWGQSNDFTVITVFDSASRRMVDMDRFNKVDWQLQRARLTGMATKWNVERIVAEKNSIGGPNIEALRREGLPVLAFETTAVSKPPLIESLVLAIEKREVELLNDPVLINELESYERTVSKDTGRSKYGAPEGLHDDVVISVALGWKAVNTARLTAY